MRALIILIISIFITSPSFGKCGSAVVVYPEGIELDIQGKVIIEGFGYGDYFEVLKKLDSTYPIFVQSGEHKVRLIKEEVIKGQFWWCQAIFRLDEELIEGRVYELRVQNLSLEHHKSFNLKKMHSNGKFGKIKWLATKVPNQNQSLDFSKLTLHESKVILYGCGPSVQTTYMLPTANKNHNFVLTEIMEENTGKTFKYYLSLKENLLIVGHGMCSGAYKFKQDKSYKIRFGTTNKKDGIDWIAWKNCPNPWDYENE